MNDYYAIFGDRFADFSPNLLSAIVLLLVGLVVAWIAAALSRRFVRKTQLHSHMARSDHWPRTGNPQKLTKAVGGLVFFFVLLFFLLPVFEALNLSTVTEPLNDFISTVFSYLPRIISAGLLLAIAWALATVTRVVVTHALESFQLDRRVGKTTHMPEDRRLPLSVTLGNVAYYLIFLLFLPAVLDALALPGILAPVQNMINEFLAALPNIIAAALLLAVAYVVAYLVRAVVENMLSALGFDMLLQRVGITGATATTRPSTVVGYVAMVAILVIATMEAAQLLGFEAFAAMLAGFMILAGRILLGVIIFVLGLAFAQWASRTIRGSGIANAHIAATAAQVAILLLSGAMALREMGIANDIVNMAFGLLLGSVAVAAAIAFGMGGMDVARDLLRNWSGKIQSGGKTTPPAGGSGM